MADLSRDRDAGPQGPPANDAGSCAVIPEMRPGEVSGVQASPKLPKHHAGQRSRTPEYRSWEHAKERCTSTKRYNAHRYIGRGIRMCQRWRESFEAFLRDLGERPGGTTLDRKDNDGHYSCGKCPECLEEGWPPNCRWATRSEQNANQSRVAPVIEFRGERLPLVEWARRLGIPRGTIHHRLKSGLTVEQALSSRVLPGANSSKGRRITFHGETLSIREWSIRLGLNRQTVSRRFACGVPLDTQTRRGHLGWQRMLEESGVTR